MSELSIIQSTDKALELLSELKAVRLALKGLEDNEKRLIQLLVAEMKEHEVLVSEDGEELVTYKYTADVNFFDAKKFAIDNPLIYTKYMSKRPGSRRFVVK